MCVFFNDTATTEIYTLSLHDALPISHMRRLVTAALLLGLALPAAAEAKVYVRVDPGQVVLGDALAERRWTRDGLRSEEHTSELQSRQYLVCRLLLEKKKNKYKTQAQQ